MASVSAREVMKSILSLRGKEQLTVIMLLWMWWDERNKTREEGRSRSPSEPEVASLAAVYAANFLKTPHAQLLSEIRQKHRWKLEIPEGVLKLNSDGAFNKEKEGRRMGLCT